MAVNWRRARARVEVIVPCITTAALVVAGAYTLLEYRDHQRDARIEKSFSYVSRLSAPPIADYRLRLGTVWSAHDEEILGVLVETAGSPETQAEAYTRTV